MMSKIPYIRVGTVYYKIVAPPTLNGDFSESLAVWSIEAIKQDEGRDYVSQVPKYDGFTCIPSHTNYQDVIGTFYNTYFPLSNKPKDGSIETTLTFLTHIFGKQLEVGLDYLQLVYTRPTQVLPILCLVSKERQTGKSTFLKWLKMLFEHNMTYVQNDSFTNQFNADWVNKLLICIDECYLTKKSLQSELNTSRLPISTN